MGLRGTRTSFFWYAGNRFNLSVALNERGTVFTDDVEGYVNLTAIRDHEWKVHFIRLWRNGSIVEQATMDWRLMSNFSFWSTDWHDFGRFPGNYYAKAKVQVWRPGESLSATQVLSSYARYLPA